MRKIVVVLWLVGTVAWFAPSESAAQFQEFGLRLVEGTQASLGNMGYARYRGFGARALGMGGAYIALSDDLTASSWNPAGLGQLAYMTGSAGLAHSSTESDQTIGLASEATFFGLTEQQLFNDPLKVSASDSETHLDYLGFAMPFRVGSDWRLALGVSYFSSVVFDQDLSDPFALSSVTINRYDGPIAPGNLIDTNTLSFDPSSETTQNRTGSLDSYSVTLAANWKERVFLGVSLNLWDGDLRGTDTLAQNFTSTSSGVGQEFRVSTTQAMDLEFSGFSPSFGILFKPRSSNSDMDRFLRKWRFGVVYKPAYTLDADGTFAKEIATEGEGERQSDRYLFDASSIDYPESFGVGVAFKPAIRWTLTADWTSTAWSGVTLSGEDRSDDGRPGDTVNMGFPSLTVLDDGRGIPAEGFDQYDTDVLRFGAEYVARAGRFRMPLRFGAFTEDAYRNVPGANGPLEVTGFSGGIGLYRTLWQLDLAVVYETADQSLSVGDTFTQPRTIGGEYVSVDYNYQSGSQFSQDSFRALLSFNYIFVPKDER
jgi:hypothetical protein